KNRLAGLKTALETTQDNETRSGLQDDFDRVSALLEKQNAAYEDFCKQNNLKRRYERMEAARWDRELSKQVRAAVKRYNEE
ncbi:MAG: hypothetical protein J6R01_08055, partial [Alistipes sp.]|nr:hypothetical protein [Alistipes sp.]